MFFISKDKLVDFSNYTSSSRIPLHFKMIKLFLNKINFQFNPFTHETNTSSFFLLPKLSLSWSCTQSLSVHTKLSLSRSCKISLNMSCKLSPSVYT